MSKSILTRAGRLARKKGWTLEAAELYLLAEKYGWVIHEEYAGKIIIYTAMDTERPVERFLFATFHERRLNRRLKDPEFMEAYEQAFTEIKNNE